MSRSAPPARGPSPGAGPTAGGSLRLLALAAALLLLPGCMWLRLLELKGQFADFDRFIEVHEEPGFELCFRRPVLLADDLVRLVGARSGATAALPGGGEVWAFPFTHLPPPVAPALLRPPGAHGETLVVVATLREGRVAGIAFPPEIFTVTPKSVAVAALRSLGGARVDAANRSASARMSAPPGAWSLPTRAGLIGLFGHPNLVQLRDGRERLVWRYLLHGAPLAEGRPVIAAAAFAFDPGAEHPAVFQVNLGGMWLSLDLPRPPAGATAARAE